MGCGGEETIFFFRQRLFFGLQDSLSPCCFSWRLVGVGPRRVIYFRDSGGTLCVVETPKINWNPPPPSSPSSAALQNFNFGWSSKRACPERKPFSGNLLGNSRPCLRRKTRHSFLAAIFFRRGRMRKGGFRGSLDRASNVDSPNPTFDFSSRHHFLPFLPFPFFSPVPLLLFFSPELVPGRKVPLLSDPSPSFVFLLLPPSGFFFALEDP